MKEIRNISIFVLLAMCVVSCEKDNYDAPNAAIKGQVYDHNGKQLQTAMAKGSMSIRIVETSFANGNSEIVVLPQDLNLKQDGSFENTRLFAGTYEMWAHEGAFYPYSEGDYQTVDMNSGKTAIVEFSVTPYLDVEWVKEPYLTSDNYLKASFRFKRNAKNGANMPDVQDAKMWISRTEKCGTEGDPNYTPNDLKITNSQEGQEIELTSKKAIQYDMKYWVRIGARCNDKYKKYNFTNILTIDVKTK